MTLTSIDDFGFVKTPIFKIAQNWSINARKLKWDRHFLLNPTDRTGIPTLLIVQQNTLNDNVNTSMICGGIYKILTLKVSPHTRSINLRVLYGKFWTNV